jgi:hypothetical protein
MGEEVQSRSWTGNIHNACYARMDY